MSYFMVVSARDNSCTTSVIPEGLRFSLLTGTQPYVLGALETILPTGVQAGIKEVYLVEDKSGTSSCLFHECVEPVHLHTMPPQDTRLGRILMLADNNDWLISAWWADSLERFVWLGRLQHCVDLLWRQLYADGNVSVGYLPQWVNRAGG